MSKSKNRFKLDTAAHRLLLCPVLLLAALSPAAASGREPAAEHQPFQFSADLQGYLDNMEYHTELREGQTVFGVSSALRLVYRPSARISASVGAFVRRDFGDPASASAAIPLARLQLDMRAWSLVFGELHDGPGHGLPDALSARERVYTPGFEEGLQVRVHTSHYEQDAWVAWYGINTPDQREHFVAGLRGCGVFGAVSFPFAVTAEHFGGEQFAPTDDSVRENAAGEAGVALRVESRALGAVGGRCVFMGSWVSARSGEGGGTGYGGALEAFMTPFGVRTSLLGYYGEGFVCWQGNPLYRSRAPVFAGEVSKTVEFVEECAAMEAGFRAEGEAHDARSFFRDIGVRVWLRFTCGLSWPFGRRSEGGSESPNTEAHPHAPAGYPLSRVVPRMEPVVIADEYPR